MDSNSVGISRVIIEHVAKSIGLRIDTLSGKVIYIFNPTDRTSYEQTVLVLENDGEE